MNSVVGNRKIGEGIQVMLLIGLGAAMTLASAAAGTAHGAVILGYGLSSLPNATASSHTESVSPTATDSSIASGGGVVSLGPDFDSGNGAPTGFDFHASTTSSGTTSADYKTSVTDATTASQYIVVSPITVNSGYSLNLQSATITSYVGAAGAYTINSVSYALNGSSTYTELDPNAGYSTTTGNFSNSKFTGTYNLAAIPALQDLAPGDTVSFRLFFLYAQPSQDGGTTILTGRTGQLTNLEFDGTSSAVPEPASLGIVSLGALVLLRRRRRGI